MEKQVFDKPGKYEINLQLNEEGQLLEWLGVVEARKIGDYDLVLTVDHRRPKTVGKVIVRGVAENGARIRISGLVRIEKKAEESESSLVMKVLLVDKESKAEVDPKMEILTNKVKASHSASVGKIDEEQLFFLESRGIEREYAKKMIINGFLN
ncbi:MAG TPA: SufD family Fe-S cluster assembly protein [Candidatus Woesebacteria bacterium]|nr:SufD family Fe-S cluster assembly protein [Candidatus Woesebacteria bacterium]